MKIKSVYFLFFIFSLIGFSSFGQTRKQLEEQRKKYQAEIVQLNKLLFNEKKKEQNAMDDLKDIKQKIEVRNKECTVLTDFLQDSTRWDDITFSMEGILMSVARDMCATESVNSPSSVTLWRGKMLARK